MLVMKDITSQDLYTLMRRGSRKSRSAVQPLLLRHEPWFSPVLAAKVARRFSVYERLDESRGYADSAAKTGKYAASRVGGTSQDLVYTICKAQHQVSQDVMSSRLANSVNYR